MRVADGIRAASERLSGTSDTARLDAELLMAHALGASRSDMLVRKMGAAVPEAFDALVARRVRREPVAYITGTAGFYGREFAVGPGILVPRPDSETLIEAALERCPAPERVLDLGTGSGALLLSVLAEWPQAEGVGIDASPVAVDHASRNAARLGLAERVDLRLGDWREPGWADDLGTFDLLVCNPPYVEEGAALEPDVRDYEPAGALFAGADGLDDYRVLFPQVRGLLRENGVALFEIGHTQDGAVRELARHAGFDATIVRDLANRPRCIALR
ncbi:MAG: peptide chain release factor N(5)-glutamine methyltransferase [Erythrobacter sp.]